MAGTILTSAANDYPPIRTLLGVSSTELPDATIEQNPFLPTAEAIVKQGITNYAALTTGDNAVLLKTGTSALCAALLCEKFEREDAEGFSVGSYTESGKKVEWHAKARQLLKDARRALGAITTRTFTRRTLVALAGPTRSGSNVPEEIEQWVERVTPRFVDWVEEGGEDDDWAAP